MLRGVGWWLATDFSGQLIGPIFKGQAVQEEQVDALLYTSGSQTFSVHRPLGYIYTPTAPPTFLKKYKCAFVSTFILYLKIV
jgi:hypothetical protein